MGLVEGAWQVCNERAASRTREAALMKRVSFHELAERELNDAALYYEQENAGLGFKFLEEVERYIGAIIKTPNAGQRGTRSGAAADLAYISLCDPIPDYRRHADSRFAHCGCKRAIAIRLRTQQCHADSSHLSRQRYRNSW